MNNFLESFSPLLKRLKKYLIEIILLTIASAIMVGAFIIYLKNNQQTAINEGDLNIENVASFKIESTPIYVDVSGSVKKAGLYKVDFGARLKDVIDKASGLSDDADTEFFGRNFNLAKIVTDQEKIYVPSIFEISNGIFVEDQRTLNYIKIAPTSDTPTNNQLINLNDATIDELDQLPGIGQVTATKIISGRPYLTIDELLSKKIINKGVFEKIKGLLTL